MTIVKKIIIVALIVLGVGAVVTFTALASAGFNVNELDTQHYVEKMENVTEGAVSTVKIVSGAYDIKVLTTNASEISVKAFDGDDVKTTITTEGNTLKIVIEDSRSWYDQMVGGIGRDRDVAVYLPGAGSYSLITETESGDVEINYSGTLASLEMSSKSGDAELERTSVSGNVAINTASGDVSLDKISIAGKISATTKSGDVEFEYITVAEANVTTESGDVEGEIGKSMNFSVTTSSGRVRVPNADPAGAVFKITTKSGNVEIGYDD